MESEGSTEEPSIAIDNVSQNMENKVQANDEKEKIENVLQEDENGKYDVASSNSNSSPDINSCKEPLMPNMDEGGQSEEQMSGKEEQQIESTYSISEVSNGNNVSSEVPERIESKKLDNSEEQANAQLKDSSAATVSTSPQHLFDPMHIADDSESLRKESKLQTKSVPHIEDATEIHLDCMVQLERERSNYEQQLEQLRMALSQKDSMIALYQRENSILDKEKAAFRKEKELATKEKESTVIKFAMKEKLLLDAKKEKEGVEKQLADARKEIKNITTRFQVVNEEKSRITYIIEEKCNEVRKYQRECEKLKTEYGHLESKLKYHMNKLQLEIEAKNALEKKLEQERNAPNKLEERANEKLKMEYEANTILLKHEIKSKSDIIENLNKENKRLNELVKQLQEQLDAESEEKIQLSQNYEFLQDEHNRVQNAYSEEMLNSAKLRGQLEDLQVLQAQNSLNEEKISSQESIITELQSKLDDNACDLEKLREKETELLSFNKEMSESIVAFQNEISLLKSKVQGVEAENGLLRKEKSQFDEKYEDLEKQLKAEIQSKNEERQILAKHLSEKTKLYEVTKLKLEDVLGDYDAAKHKHSTELREVQRELQKYKKLVLTQPQPEKQRAAPNTTSAAASRASIYADAASNRLTCSNCRAILTASDYDSQSKLCKDLASGSQQHSPSARSTSTVVSRHNSTDDESGHRQQKMHTGLGSRLPSESSESDTVISNNSSKISSRNARSLNSVGASNLVPGKTTTTPPMSETSSVLSDDSKGPTKKHLVERILRLQQASARQAEKIDFLEQHSLSLVAELQKKSKVVQYYMLRDQAGALTSTKSDQHKSELSKYGNGVMSAIYGGIKPDNKSMTLDLSLEINKKLQAVLEDTLLKNITLKENLDVLGIEVDNLTRKLRQMESKK